METEQCYNTREAFEAGMRAFRGNESPDLADYPDDFALAHRQGWYWARDCQAQRDEN